MIGDKEVPYEDVVDGLTRCHLNRLINFLSVRVFRGDIWLFDALEIAVMVKGISEDNE
jgi:hypothetical protein